MEFVALDFQTACACRDSACSIGLVTVKNGQIVDEYYKLIRPKRMYFNQENIETNNITPEMVKAAPTFEELWPEIFERLQHKQVASHFAKFGINVLISTLNAYYLPHPNFEYICTWILAKKAFPDLERYALDAVAERIGFKYTPHHALEDARACAAIVSKVLEKTPAQDFSHLADIYDFGCGRLTRTDFIACTLTKEEQEKPLGRLS